MLKKVKQNISAALERIGLKDKVSLNEIEKEVSQNETSFQSLLILGILYRIMHLGDNKVAELFIPSVTEWKNYLPHEELGGLSPEEAMKKYPPGPNESFFIAAMMHEYQTRLELLGKGASPEDSVKFDTESDFSKFQEDYLNRMPSDQIFEEVAGRLMTIKEIIVEERRKAARPEETIDKIGVKIFAENTAEGTGAKIAAIDDAYFSALEELKKIQKDHNYSARQKDRIHEIRRQLERDEPFHRCGPAPHQFYANYAAVVFLDGKDPIDFVISLLDRSLNYKPDYDSALQMKRRLQENQ
ncbi:MAG: hypothetical protein ABH841_00170 [Candidatus Nealsonbacteria bacterium]